MAAGACVVFVAIIVVVYMFTAAKIQQIPDIIAKEDGFFYSFVRVMVTTGRRNPQLSKNIAISSSYILMISCSSGWLRFTMSAM